VAPKFKKEAEHRYFYGFPRNKKIQQRSTKFDYAKQDQDQNRAVFPPWTPKVDVKTLNK
jgi:hypothetical protein